MKVVNLRFQCLLVINTQYTNMFSFNVEAVSIYPTMCNNRMVR